ncbi:protein WVD2-like 7 isoform X2 [Aristolochia californica]|uniref:protein WVD2-like 7 isoform X2 n=1 Tax=Aristolochia californica TaxID=171875 RepID=UPI0035D8654F
MAEALRDIPERQTELTLKSIPTESVSFGRFAGDNSFSRDKWSAFSQNKYMEEVGKCSTPGSVAEKKAYFEDHYKRFAAQTMELLAQDKQTDAGHPNSEEQNFHKSWGNSEVSDSTNVDVEQLINGSSDSIHAHETSRFMGESKEEMCTKPDFPEAKDLEAKMDTTVPKLEALESKLNEGINESENLEAAVDEAESLESKVDHIGNKTEVLSNKVAILELEEVGKEADASEPQKDELGSKLETSTLQMQEMRGKTEILEADVDEIAARPSEDKVTEASGLADVCESMLDGVGSKISEPMVDEIGIQPDCSVSNVDIVVRDDDNFTESQASDEMSQQLDEKSNKSPVPKLDGERHSPMNKLSKKKVCTPKQTESNAQKKRRAVTPASPKPKLQNHSTPKSSKVTPASPLTPASKFSQRRDSCSLSSENKRETPTSLDSSNLRSVTVDSASPPTNRRDLIMEKMGDKEIVQKAFKTFRNSLNLLRSSNDAEKPVLKGKQQPESLEKTQLQRKQPGARTPNMTSGSLNEARGSKKVSKAASLSLELRRDDAVEKQKDLLSALKKRSNPLGSHSDCI